MEQLYMSIKQAKISDLDALFDTLLQKYPIEYIDFAMYDTHGYIHETIESKKVRNDATFRAGVLERYNNECLISHVNEPCEVCHIKPFSKCNDFEKYDINNGIVLRCDLHRLFDTGKLKINPTTIKIELTDDVMKNKKMIDYHKYSGILIDVHPKSRKYLLS